jgi:hypothetical protein
LRQTHFTAPLLKGRDYIVGIDVKIILNWKPKETGNEDVSALDAVPTERQVPHNVGNSLSSSVTISFSTRTVLHGVVTMIRRKDSTWNNT